VPNAELEERTRSILVDYATKLAALGSAEAIALHLAGREVKAWCGESNRCALADDLTKTLVENGVLPYSVDVGGDFMVYLTLRGGPDETWVAHPTPMVADEFIERYDQGEFSDLIHPDDAAGLKKAREFETEKELSL
jgi:hypothetical protein